MKENQDKNLHIVTFAVPYPANYGGAIDAWNRIVALSRLGVQIKLHCFLYRNFRSQSVIREYVREVHYYPRVVWPALFAKGQPYVVTSRKCRHLLKRLQADNDPILFDGIQATGYHADLPGRVRMLRAHNIEHEYYGQLAEEGTGVKSLVYKREALCLHEYETAIAKSFDAVFAISPHDYQWYQQQGATAILMPPFHGLSKIDIKPGQGDYMLYQGDLSIEINQAALLDLLKQLPEDNPLPIVVAGRSGSKTFESILAEKDNIQRKADVTDSEMIEWVRNAQMTIIHSLHLAGMKLKLFTALYHGRHILASDNCKTHTPLDRSIHYYAPGELSASVGQYIHRAFTAADIQERTEVLQAHPGDIDMAKEIVRYL